jgi:hypothetical protein
MLVSLTEGARGCALKNLSGDTRRIFLLIDIRSVESRSANPTFVMLG